MTDMSTGSYYYRLNIGINTLCMNTLKTITLPFMPPILDLITYILKHRVPAKSVVLL